MAYISYNKLWKNEFDVIVSEKYKLQDIDINQIKLEVHDTYRKDEKKQQILNLQMMGIL